VNKPNARPAGWGEGELGDLLALLIDYRGRTPKKLGMEWGEGTIPALSAINVRPGSLDLSRTEHFGSDSLYRRWMTMGDPQRGDIIITTEAPLGNVAQIPDDERYILSQRVILLRPRSTVLHSDFLARLMRGSAFQQSLRANDSGSTVTGIRQSRLVRLPVPCPPLNEQRRIVAKIEALTARSRAAREALEQVPPLLERFRQSVLAAAFRGDLTAEWRRLHPDVEPASVLLERIRAERQRRWGTKFEEPEPPSLTGLPELPAGWVWARLVDLLEAPLGNGLSIKGTDTPPGVASLKLSAMTDDGFDYTKVKYLPTEIGEVERLLVCEADFFVSRGNGSKDLVARGTLAQAPPFPVIFPDLMIRVRLADELRRSRWIPGIWPAPQIRRQVEARVKTTAGIWKISQTDLGLVAVPVPPLQEQVAAARALNVSLTWAGRQRELSEHALAGITRIDQSILAKAFRGELVPQDPNDEPASVLLDRIRAEREATGADGTRTRRSRRARASEAEPTDAEDEPDDAPAAAHDTGTNDGSTLHAILGALKREALHRIADAEGVELADRRSLDAARSGVSEGGVALEAALEHLDRDELRAVCRVLGLEDRGRTKEELRARVIAWCAEAERGPLDEP
jgi:type I restriction enzyme, S subunit